MSSSSAYSFRKELVTKLTAAVSSTPVYAPPVKPDAAFPFVVYTIVSDVYDTADLTARTLHDVTIQLDVYALEFADAEARRDLLIAALDRPGERISFGAKTAERCRITRVDETSETEANGDDRTVVRFTLNLEIKLPA